VSAAAVPPPDRAPARTTGPHPDELLPLRAVLPRLIEAMSDAVLVLDRRGMVVAANHRFIHAFGAEGAAAVGRPCPRAGNCPTEGSDPDPPCMGCEIATTRAPRRALQILPDASGQQRCWEATLNPVLDEQGQVSLVVEVWRDITDRSQLEAQLSHSERLASLGLLAAGVAHEINNPLAAVLAGVEVLERLLGRTSLPVEEAEEATEVLRLLRQETRRCSETTDKLLLLGQQHASHSVWVNMNRAASDTLALLSFATRKQGIVVRAELAEQLPSVWGREGALRGTLMNLCLNAVQAMPGGGTLTVRTRLAGDSVALEVEDDGPGILPEHLSRIWDPFFTTKPVGQGTGLGLSITQRIVTDHGGDIRVTSTPGRGACFIMTLPTRHERGAIG
jgi:PAS domain S-box-containing protein